MVEYTVADLGAAIRELRVSKEMPDGKKMTQAQLGASSNYGGGAGVTISRIENGALEPRPKQLESIAAALGVEVAEIKKRAAQKAAKAAQKTRPQDPAALLEKIKRANEDGHRAVSAVESFKVAHENVNDGFLLKLRDLAARIQEIEPVSELQLAKEMTLSPQPPSEAAFQLDFTTLGLSGVLADSAHLGGGDTSADGITQGVTVLAGTSALAALLAAASAASTGATAAAMARGFSAAVARPVVSGASAAVGMAAAMGVAAFDLGLKVAANAKRSRLQQERAAAEIGKIAAEIEKAQPGVDAILDVVPDATSLLDYISVHATHALERWERTLDQGTLQWHRLTPEDQEKYREFERIAAAQVAVSNIDIQTIYASRDEDLDRVVKNTRALIREARDLVAQYV